MSNIKLIGQNRSFLNEDPEISLVSMLGYAVSVSSWNEELVKEGHYDNADIQFAMSDCSRSIHLDFSIGSKEAMRNSLYKLNTIIKVCESMKADLKEARLIVNAGNKRREELDKKEK